MRQRLPIAISAAALAVALLGSTSLGEAARNGVASGVSKAKRAAGLTSDRRSTALARGPRGRRGPRGYRGARGPRGFLGAPGEKGEKGDRGDVGPSNAYEFRWTAPVDITGTTPETATIVANPSTALPAGKYAVSAQMVVTGGGGDVHCRARGPGPTGPYLGELAMLEVSSADGTLPLAFGADLASGGTISIACWQLGTTGAEVGPGEIVAVKVGELTTIN